jgi:RNA polymerase sigma-70 factor (ECF subfamily)
MDLSKTDHSPETDRILRAAQGDQAAWSELLSTHRARLRRMVSLRLDRRLRGRIDPSDVIQEAFLDASAGLAHYVERAEMPFFLWLRWLTGMKLNTLHRKHLGTKVRDAGREISLDRGAAPQASSAALAAQLLGRLTTASEAAIRLEQKARLEAAIDALDPLDREIVVLRHFEELTNAEAAQTLGLQVSTASKRYVRAICRLKEALRSLPGRHSEFDS